MNKKYRSIGLYFVLFLLVTNLNAQNQFTLNNKMLLSANWSSQDWSGLFSKNNNIESSGDLGFYVFGINDLFLGDFSCHLGPVISFSLDHGKSNNDEMTEFSFGIKEKLSFGNHLYIPYILSLDKSRLTQASGQDSYYSVRMESLSHTFGVGFLSMLSQNVGITTEATYTLRRMYNLNGIKLSDVGLKSIDGNIMKLSIGILGVLN